MSSRYQTSSTTVATNNNYNSDNKLDELLEDLQSTVAPRPLMNGNGNSNGTGYRQTYKSYSTQKTGCPVESSEEYEVEYLNPSNTTAVVSERSRSPFFDKENLNLTNGKNASSYKTMTYEYSTKRTGSQPASPVFENKQTEKSEAKFRKNINELDSLLDDLNHTQKIEFSGSNHNSRIKGYDSGFMEPLDSSTPQKNSHVSRIEEKSYQEQRYGSVNSAPIRHTEVKKEVIYNGEPVESYVDKYSTSNDFKKDLVFTGGSLRHREPSPARQLQEVYHYETKTTSTAKKGAEIPPPRTVGRTYNYESDVTDSSIPYTNDRYVTNAYEYNRSPSPARSGPNYNTISSTNSTLKESTLRRTPSPTRSYYSTTSSVRNITPQPITRSAVYSSRIVQESSKRETQRSPFSPPPPPHRSPSPVSFAQPPDPPLETSVRTYNFERSSSGGSSSNNVVRQQSPQFRQRFSPSDPTRDTQPAGHTVITRNYKYTSQSSQNSKYPANDGYRPEPTPPPVGRPFPAPSPQPEIKEQKPPKQLDELMASFSDSESHHREVFNRYSANRTSNRSQIPVSEPLQCKTPPPAPVPVPSGEKIHTIETQKLNECTKEKTNGVAGPPVYYPPGPLFTKKDECSAVMMEQSAGGKGKMNAKRKAKYKYESGGKMKESSDTKKTVVPLCLPVCCALPCAIV